MSVDYGGAAPVRAAAKPTPAQPPGDARRPLLPGRAASSQSPASAAHIDAAIALESRQSGALAPPEIADAAVREFALALEPDPLVGLDIDTDELVRRMAARKDALFERQTIAPAPSQTYWQVVVYPEEVILRDWPRKRLAMPAPPPGQNPVTIKEFLGGEQHDQIKAIFGQETLDECIRAAKEAARRLTRNGASVNFVAARPEK